MIFRSELRGEDQVPDWSFGRGKQSYLTGNQAIKREIETRLGTFYSECFFDGEKGVDWFSILGQKDPDIVVLSIKKEISDCYGVVRVSDIRYTLDSSRNLSIRYWVDTIYTTSVYGTVTI
jgi:hypothetical protein